MSFGYVLFNFISIKSNELNSSDLENDENRALTGIF